MMYVYFTGAVVTYAAIIWAYTRYERDPYDVPSTDISVAALCVVPAMLWPLTWLVAPVVAFMRKGK